MSKSFKKQINPTFKAAVKIPRVGDEPMAVTFEFKTMDRLALAKMFDSWKQDGIALLEKSAEREAAGNPFTLTEWLELEIPVQVKQIKDIVVGWGFSDEFNDENIAELLGTSTAVTDVILEEYNDAFMRARQGN